MHLGKNTKKNYFRINYYDYHYLITIIINNISVVYTSFVIMIITNDFIGSI